MNNVTNKIKIENSIAFIQNRVHSEAEGNKMIDQLNSIYRAYFLDRKSEAKHHFI